MINYVSNLPRELRTGGFSGINVAAVEALSKFEPVHYVGPVNPPFVFVEKARSKILRSVGLRGAFAFFSERRLATIAREAAAQCRKDARLDFFLGFTPWVRLRPERPYLAYGDCIFRDYVDVYHRREQFQARDLERVEAAEAEWLRGARKILFTTAWAAQHAVEVCGVEADRVGVVGLYCDVELPERDLHGGEPRFVFTATNFAAKGGPVVLAAFRELRGDHPDATLTVVGDRPAGAQDGEGVSFVGFLRKENAQENARLRQLLGEARALVHPTKSDIGPLIIVEAGYYGCPAISSRRFGIPELIDHEKSGILLDDPSRAGELAAAMRWMLEHDDAYRAMREAAWKKARGEHSKARYQERLLSFVTS